MNVNFISQSADLLNWTNGVPSQVIAMNARVSTDTTAKTGEYCECRKLCRKLLDWGHYTPLEFFEVTFGVITSRAVSHQLVRHRLASYMQESQRYCQYDDGINVIVPTAIQRNPDPEILAAVAKQVTSAANAYKFLLDKGVKAEDARSVLPECTATKLHVKMNLREFRHFLSLRTSHSAWSEMQALATGMADAFSHKFPDEIYLIKEAVC